MLRDGANGHDNGHDDEAHADDFDDRGQPRYCHLRKNSCSRLSAEVHRAADRILIGSGAGAGDDGDHPIHYHACVRSAIVLVFAFCMGTLLSEGSKANNAGGIQHVWQMQTC